MVNEICICGNTLVFGKRIYKIACSECGREWSHTSKGNLSQNSRPTKRTLDWRVGSPSQALSTPEVLSIGEQYLLLPANQ